MLWLTDRAPDVRTAALVLGRYPPDGRIYRLALRRVDLRRTNFYHGTLINVDLGDSNLADCYAADVRWQRCRFRNTDLRKMSLMGAALNESDFTGAYLQEANLEGATLRQANLSRASLRGANLRDADLRDANLNQADLSGADLSGAQLRRSGGQCPGRSSDELAHRLHPLSTQLRAAAGRIRRPHIFGR